MPFVRDVAVTEFISTSAAAGTANMPVHASGDILLVFQVKDASAVPTQVGSNYTVLESGTSTGAGGGCWWRRATSSAEPAFASTWTADSSVMVVVSCGGVHGTNAPTSVRDSSNLTTIPFTTTGTLNTPSINCLIVVGLLADNVNGPTPWPTDLQALYCGDSGEAGLGVGWAFEPTLGTSCTGKRFYAGTADDARSITVCIEDDGNNEPKQAYVDPTSTAPTFISPLTGAALTVSSRAWSLPTSITAPLLGRNVEKYYNYDGSNWTDDTTDINDVGTGDVSPTNTTSGIIHFGYATPFDQLSVAVSTAGTGSPAATWEYWNGSAWATLPGITSGVAGDLNFTATGNKTFRWAAPSDWATKELDATNAPGARYYIRRRQTANWTIAAVLSQATIGGMGNLYDAVTSTGDSGVNPYHSSNALSGPATVPDTNQLAGHEYLSDTAIDMDPGYLLSQFRYAAPRDGIDCGLFYRHRGISFGLWDTSDNYRIWTIAAKDAKDSNYFDKLVFGIQPAQATVTAWGEQNQSGSFDASLINTVYTGATSAFAAVAAQFSQLLLVNGSVIVAGGTSTTPLAFPDIMAALVAGCGLFPVVSAAGSAATLFVPVQMGGADPAHIVCSLATFQFPTQASLSARTGAWHVDDGTVGIEFYGQASEKRHFLGCTFISGSPYYWRFNAAHSGSTLVDFTGSTVVNALITLQSTVTLSTVTFQNCTTFTLNSAVLDKCTFKNTKVSAASPADAADITNSTFVSGGTGHALEIGGSAADVTLTGCTFTGYATSDGSTGNEAIYVNIGTGTMTITITDGTTPSIRTAGADVTVLAGQVAATVKCTTTTGTNLENVRVLLLAAAGGPMPSDATVTIVNSGTTATVTHTAHGMLTNDKVQIKGASLAANNGVWSITKTGDNTYTYTMGSSPGSNPTGTIKATFAVLSGLTSASGEITMSRVFASEQPVSGRARLSTSPNFYKTAAIVGTISSTGGFSTTVQMIADV